MIQIKWKPKSNKTCFKVFSKVVKYRFPSHNNIGTLMFVGSVSGLNDVIYCSFHSTYAIKIVCKFTKQERIIMVQKNRLHGNSKTKLNILVFKF